MITIEKTFPGTIAYPLERLGDPEKLVFFDIETTGFSADYNIVYLIGCIWPEGDHLRFIQRFADTKAAEADVLTAFFYFLKDFRTLVHFNGDMFDIPFVTKRAKALKLTPAFDSVESVDIFRRIKPFKKLLGLPDMKQKTIERFLKIGREDLYNGGELIEVYLDYLRTHYPQFYLVSSTTKVLTDFRQLRDETAREEFRYVVPDFRLNKAFEQLDSLTQPQKDKVEFLCNECCWVGCRDRKRCYENVSRKNLGEDCPDHRCTATGAQQGYRFSKAMENPGFIGAGDIRKVYLPGGFSNFKIEGRGLGSALILEFLLYYMTKPEYQLRVREEIYLDNMLDLF